MCIIDVEGLAYEALCSFDTDLQRIRTRATMFEFWSDMPISNLSRPLLHIASYEVSDRVIWLAPDKELEP